MTPQDYQDAAKRLDHAEKARHQIGCFTQDFPAMGMADAYAVQGAWVKMKLVERRRIRGRKIGLTSRAMQMQLDIDIPDSGILFDDMFFDNGAQIPNNRFIEPRVEAEIAFVMASDLHGGGCTTDDVLNATEAVAPSIEILDTRIFRKDPVTGKSRTVMDTIADNAANAGIILGAERFAPREVNLIRTGAIVSRDGIVEETGLGAGVLGDPVLGMVWLADRLAQHDDYIKRGEVVLSGSFVRAIEAPSGSEFEVDFGAFGSVGCTFE